MLQAAGCRQGRELAGTVAGHGVRLEPQAQQQQIDRPVGGEHAGNRIVQPPQITLGPLPLLCGKRRIDEDGLADRRPQPALPAQPIALLEVAVHLGEVRQHVGQHVQVLGALAGEEQAQLALRVQRLLEVVGSL
jgi:hypothetical protein